MIPPTKNGSKSHKRQQMDHNAPKTARVSDCSVVGERVRIEMPSNGIK
jgi:hypothetical protein